MRLSREEDIEFYALAGRYLDNPNVKLMDRYKQHGVTTTLDHSVAVARLSFFIAKRMRLRLNYKALVKGALLHDFYLYDWHVDPGHPWHGFRHPASAAKLAESTFGLNEIEDDIIRKHMWPFTLTKVPKYRESMLVSTADKICALGEFFRLIKPFKLKTVYLNK